MAPTASSPHRVVLTGLGLVSPLGITVAQFWEALVEGRSGVGPLQGLPTSHLPVAWAAEAREFTGKIDDFGPLDKNQKRAIRKGIKMMCREIQMAVAAAQRALDQAGLHPGTYDVDRTGVVYGSDYILTDPAEFLDAVAHCLDPHGQFVFDQWSAQGLPRVTPLWLLKYLPNMPASHIAIYNDLRGPSNSLTVREASSNLAVREAAHLIARGAADIMVAGGTGTRVHPLRTLHVLLQEEVARDAQDPTQASRPFDLNRSGMVLGEGAGAVVLESLESARRRGAPIWGEVVGSGSSAVMGSNGGADCRQALSNVLRQTLADARLTPDQVGHVHAHGLSTRSTDRQEAEAIADVFAERPTPVPVIAAKSHFGNTGAAAGLLELISSVLAQEHNRLFPVLNYQTPDPACPLNVVTSGDMEPGDVFINLNVTPQGQASAVAIRRFGG